MDFTNICHSLPIASKLLFKPSCNKFAQNKKYKCRVNILALSLTLNQLNSITSVSK